jgi:glyoxylase-like metal-dependent hydrolase (beta-lactamase superfamily II)
MAGALHEIGDGVWAWIQPTGGFGVTNAGVIRDGDELTVVDALMVPSQFEPFGDAVDALRLPVRRLVLTSSHIDHVGGSWRFRLAAVYGSSSTSYLLDQEPNLDLYKRFMPAYAAEFDELARRREELQAEEIQAPTRRRLGFTRQVTHVVASSVSLTPRVEVLPAAGHTPGDLLVLVEDADVLFVGGLGWFGVTPLCFQGDPAQWADVLDVVTDLAGTIVPGHGPVGGAAEVRELQAYLRACVAGPPLPPGPWDAWDRRDYDPVNWERAELVARGEDAMPPTMARMLGLA